MRLTSRLLLLVLSGWVLGGGVCSAWTLVDHGIVGDATGSSASIAVTLNTTGADLIVVFAASGGGGTGATISDSQGGGSNTYSQLTAQSNNNRTIRIWYAWNPTHVGSTHVITQTNNGDNRGVMAAMAWSGSQTASDPFDVQNGAGTNGSATLQTGSVATASGELIVSGATMWNDTNLTIDSSFTRLDYTDTGSGNPHQALASAYKVQTGASENPTWSGAAVPLAVNIATFKASGGGGGGSSSPCILGGGIIRPGCPGEEHGGTR